MFVLQVFHYPESILVLNKCDLVHLSDRAKLIQLGMEMSREYQFQECFSISALHGVGIKKLKDYLLSQVWNTLTTRLGFAQTRHAHVLVHVTQGSC